MCRNFKSSRLISTYLTNIPKASIEEKKKAKYLSRKAAQFITPLSLPALKCQKFLDKNLSLVRSPNRPIRNHARILKVYEKSGATFFFFSRVIDKRDHLKSSGKKEEKRPRLRRL